MLSFAIISENILNNVLKFTGVNNAAQGCKIQMCLNVLLRAKEYFFNFERAACFKCCAILYSKAKSLLIAL